jgi:hypothetical protein
MGDHDAMTVSRTLRRSLLVVAACALMPTAALAQQNDNPGEGTPDEQVMTPGTDQAGATGTCGLTGTMPTSRSSLAVAPTGEGEANKDVTGAQRLDLSQVQGTIVHMEGDLALIRISPLQMTPAAGGPQQTQLVVVRLPADCMTGEFDTGSSVLVIGTPGSDGILGAETVQPAT